MKKLLGLIIVLFFISCDADENSAKKSSEANLENNFTVSGKIKNANAVNFYLEGISQQGTISIAQTKSNDSGEFEMSGNIPGLGMYQLRMGETNNKIIPLTLSPGEKVKVESSTENFEKTPRISGTAWADLMTRYMQVYSNFRNKQEELQRQQGSIDNDELTKRFFKLKTVVDEFAISEMDKDPGNSFNIVLSASALPNMGFEYWDEQYLAVIQKVSKKFAEIHPKSPYTVSLSNQAYQLEIEYNKYLMNNSGTVSAPEIALNNPEGKEIKLSSLKGKYVLIDFWASWCGPCRKESPNVVRLYNQYKDKGFTVYSVSLDDNLEAWKAAIVKDGLVWPNHVSDLKRWNSPLPQLYGFNGIPYTVLINKEGKIIGVGLRGASLEQKLKEIFSK